MSDERYETDAEANARIAREVGAKSPEPNATDPARERVVTDTPYYTVRECRGHFHVTTPEYDVGATYSSLRSAQYVADLHNEIARLTALLDEYLREGLTP